MADLSVTILRRISSDLSPFSDMRDIPEDTLDSFIVSLEFVYRALVILETTSELSTTQCETVGGVRSCLSTLKSVYEFRKLKNYLRMVCTVKYKLCELDW